MKFRQSLEQSVNFYQSLLDFKFNRYNKYNRKNNSDEININAFQIVDKFTEQVFRKIENFIIVYLWPTMKKKK